MLNPHLYRSAMRVCDDRVPKWVSFGPMRGLAYRFRAVCVAMRTPPLRGSNTRLPVVRGQLHSLVAGLSPSCDPHLSLAVALMLTLTTSPLEKGTRWT
jgi:hypothetical protein